MERDDYKRWLKNLPMDLIVDGILPRLPPKSLVRFTSVCKARYSVIKSPPFIAAHRDLLCRRENLMIVDGRSSRVHDGETLVQLAEFNFDSYSFLDMQSCNGLFLIFHTDMKHILWNPSIRKSKVLDQSTGYFCCVHKGQDAIAVHGLGFHESTNDHRVVRIVCAFDEESRVSQRVPPEVDVYSLSSGSWHRATNANPGRLFPVFFNRTGLYFNRAVHWFSCTRMRSFGIESKSECFESILLFDFGDECFREIGLPEGLRFYKEKCVGGLKEVEGNLGFLSEIYRGFRYCFWDTTEYGNSNLGLKSSSLISQYFRQCATFVEFLRGEYS